VRILELAYRMFRRSRNVLLLIYVVISILASTLAIGENFDERLKGDQLRFELSQAVLTMQRLRAELAAAQVEHLQLRTKLAAARAKIRALTRIEQAVEENDTGEETP